MSDKCKHGVRDAVTNLPYCKRCNDEAKAHSLHRLGSAPSPDDWQEAYEEAAGHLEYLAGIPTDHTDGEREAKRRLAKRLRTSARRMAQNGRR